MFLFRSTFVTATVTFVCIFAILGQFATGEHSVKFPPGCAANIVHLVVHAAPQFGMRPKFNVYGVDATDSELLSYLPPSATARLATASAASESAVSSAETAETTQSSESSSSSDTVSYFVVVLICTRLV